MQILQILNGDKKKKIIDIKVPPRPPSHINYYLENYKFGEVNVPDS